MPPIITDINDLDLNGTYADYLQWQFEERLELIKRKIFKISPAPITRHHVISTNLQGNLFIYLKDQPHRLFSAPFDVRLFDSKKAALALPTSLLKFFHLEIRKKKCITSFCCIRSAAFANIGWWIRIVMPFCPMY